MHVLSAGPPFTDGGSHQVTGDPPAIACRTSHRKARDHNTSAAGTNISQLPESVLVHILHYVPQQARLSRCALVGRTWAAAAAAATSSIAWVRNCSVKSRAPREEDAAAACVAASLASFQAWLDQHAEQLVSVSVSIENPHELRLRLPPAMPRLQRLSIDGVRPQLSGVASLTAGAGQPTASGGSSERSQHDDASGAILAVVLLPQLNSLELGSRAGSDFVAMLLQHMPPTLTVLKLQCWSLRESALAPLSTLQQLQCCVLPEITLASLTALSGISTLTELSFQLEEWAVFDAATFSGAGWCSNLKVLRLDCTGLEPAVLAGFSQLESLYLDNCILCRPEVGPYVYRFKDTSTSSHVPHVLPYS